MTIFGFATCNEINSLDLRKAVLRVCKKKAIKTYLINSYKVEVFRIFPEFRVLRLTFHRKSASKC